MNEPRFKTLEIPMSLSVVTSAASSVSTSTPVVAGASFVPTAPQALAAFALAFAFGHGWARELAYAEYMTTIGGNPARWMKEGYDAFVASPAFRKIVAARRSDLNYALNAAEAADPSTNCGILFATEHDTGSKTLSWSVSPDGSVQIVVRAGPSSRSTGEWTSEPVELTVVATVSVAPNGDTRWVHRASSPWRGELAGGRLGSHVNAADGKPFPGSDEYAYEVAARAVRALGGRVEAQPQIRRLPRGRRGLAGIA